MNKQSDIFLKRHTEYANRDDKTAIALIAQEVKESEAFVELALSKADTIENRLLLKERLASIDDIDPSVKEQNDFIAKSKELFQLRQDELASLDRDAVAVFISDRHIPYDRKDSYELTLSILSDMPHVDYITCDNDILDNEGWGRWDDERRARRKIWSEDIAYASRVLGNEYQMLRTSAPDATLLSLMGNHDIWYHKRLRKHSPQNAERAIADRMAEMDAIGVLQFSRGFHENYIRLAPDLVFVHGRWAAKLATSNARNAIAHFMSYGIASNVVMGHTHRGAVVSGGSVGYNGVWVVNNHCMRKADNVSYLPMGYAPNWTQGICIVYFRPDGRRSRYDLVEYVEHGRDLVAYVNSKRYSVPLNKDG